MTAARKEPSAETYSGRFAIRLRTLREKAGLTAQQLAEKVGVTDSTVYHWESAHSFPKVDLLPEIAAAIKLRKVKDLFPE